MEASTGDNGRSPIARSSDIRNATASTYPSRRISPCKRMFDIVPIPALWECPASEVIECSPPGLPADASLPLNWETRKLGPYRATVRREEVDLERHVAAPGTVDQRYQSRCPRRPPRVSSCRTTNEAPTKSEISLRDFNQELHDDRHKPIRRPIGIWYVYRLPSDPNRASNDIVLSQTRCFASLRSLLLLCESTGN